MNPYGHPEVIATLRGNAPRILSDGLVYSDLLFLERDITEPTQWCERWVALSHTYEDLAQAALAERAALTAGDLLWRAALCCHFGQGLRMDVDPVAKHAADARKNALFRQAAPLLSPPLQRIDIAFEGHQLPGYLRLPLHTQSAVPCVIIFGGLDTTKEDALEISNHFVARGMATLLFDGPGQGEALHGLHLPLRMDFHRAVIAAVDYACACDAIDASRIGVLGRSTGGHWACVAAARDPRIQVAIAWGLIWHLRHFASLPPDLKQRFMRSAQADTEGQAMDFFAPFDLDGVVQDIRCPVMAVQGGKDVLAPAASTARLQAQAKGEVKIVVYPDSGHCAHDKTHLSKPLMADFAARHLWSNP